VQSLEPAAVRAEIERLIVTAVESVLTGEGFQYSVPSRSSTNQL
jgi:hypothetical protein